MSTTTLLYGIFVCRRIIRYKVVLCHGGTFGGTARLHGLACHDPDYVNAPADSLVRVAFQHHKRPARPRDRFTRPHQLTTRRTLCSSAPAHNAAADSSVCSCGRFTPRGRLARPHRLTTLRPTLSSAPAYNVAADSLDRTGLQCYG